MLKNKINDYIKNIAKQVFDEMQPKEDEYNSYSLPDIDRNKYLAMSIQKTHKDITPRIPAGATMDSCVSQSFDKLQNAYNVCNPINDIIYTHFATQGFIGFQACAILVQNWLINKACLTPTKDAIRPDYELTYVTTDDAEELDQDFLTEITDLSNDTKKFDIKEVCRTFAEKKRQFGQVLAYPIIEGADYEQPFNIDSIALNSYKGMTVVDPVWYQAILDEDAINNPQSLRYMKPTYFEMPNGVKVHHSWCIFGKNGDVPDVLKPTYRWGGYPIPQLIYKRAYAAEKTANEAPMLAQSKRLLVVDINPMGLLTQPQRTKESLEAATMFRDNWGVMAKRPGDGVAQIDTSLTDLDEVIMTQYQLVAAAAGLPATKLLETQPKGFNSTGDYEDDQYKLTLVSIQNEDFKPILDFHYAILTMSKYGIKRDFTINFKEIDTPTEKERAEINEIKARTDASYIQAGVFSPDEVRDNVVKDANSGYNNIEGEIEDNEGDFSFSDEGEGSLEDLVNDPNVTPSEAATLNGVQVTSMVNIASQVAKGDLSRESAIAILQKSFNLSTEEAENIIGSEKLPDQDPKGNGETQQDPFNSTGAMDDNEPKDWFTSNGAHIPIENGQTENQAFKEITQERQKENKETSKEEKQKKIDSVQIDPTKDNILPELNKEDLAEIGKESKLVKLKKETLERNKDIHSDIDDTEYNYLIGNALYNPKFVFPANKEKPDYFHFIASLGENKNSAAIVELSENKDNYEIVHIQKMRNRGVNRLIKRDKK